MEKVYCPNCGAELENGAECRFCAATARMVATAATVKKSKKKIIIAILALAVAGAVAAFFFMEKSGNRVRMEGGYKAVKIGDQIWMAENLNIAIGNSVCYNNKAENCQKYGRLYNWATAMKACPNGWHLPKKAEFVALENAVGGSLTAGRKLKATIGWISNGNGTDDYSFAALPAGVYSALEMPKSGHPKISDFRYFNYGELLTFWSATEDNVNLAWIWWVNNLDGLSRGDSKYKIGMRSVRCVKD
jgi:uncharacterized protein (TIGR02145 family)